VDYLDRTTTLPPVTRARPARILVIEDDRHVRSLLCDVLRTWGYQVDVAAGGREGLERFDPDRHDVVLTDFAMPELTGVDVVAGLRDRDREVPVIMLTGSIRDLDRDGRRLGFRVLHKPLDIDSLRQVIRDSLVSPRPF
jgi:DNA-binding response OmpR family regulator